MWKYFSIILLAVIQVELRGPHHPRGDKIVKRHVHYTPSKDTNTKLTEDMQLLHDKEHIQEHLEDIIPEPDLSKMTDEELEFYYFQVHDTDKNSKLDGLELLQGILHADHQYENEEEVESSRNVNGVFSFSFYVELVDQVLVEDDVDHDGFLTYSEYASKRRLHHNKNALQHNNK